MKSGFMTNYDQCYTKKIQIKINCLHQNHKEVRAANPLSTRKVEKKLVQLGRW